MSDFNKIGVSKAIGASIENRYLSKEQFTDLVKANTHLIFSVGSLNKYRAALYEQLQKLDGTTEGEGMIKKAQDDFKTLQRKTVLNPDGTSFDIFLKEKDKNDLKKGFPNQDEDADDDDEDEDDDQGADQDNNDEGNQDDQGQEGDEDEDTTDEEGDEDEEGDDENVDADNQDDNNDQGTNQGNDDGGNDGQLSDDDIQVLKTIQSVLQEDGSVEEAELEQTVGGISDDVKSIVDNLKGKGLIECDDNYNITAITDAGQAALQGGGDDSNGDVDGDGNNDQTNGQQANDQQQGQQNGLGDDQQQQGQDGQNPQAPGQMDDEKLKAFAKQTDSETLKKFIANPKSNDVHKKIAQDELNSRGEGDQNGQQGQDGQQQGQDGQQMNGQEDGNGFDEEAFKKWMDQHLTDHDIEDLRKYTKKLIQDSPAKLKELKAHYRDDFSKQNRGNSVDKIDDGEFDDWLDQYLSHLPFNDLKDYASKMIGKNPKAFKDLKNKFGELQENNML